MSDDCVTYTDIFSQMEATGNKMVVPMTYLTNVQCLIGKHRHSKHNTHPINHVQCQFQSWQSGTAFAPRISTQMCSVHSWHVPNATILGSQLQFQMQPLIRFGSIITKFYKNNPQTPSKLICQRNKHKTPPRCLWLRLVLALCGIWFVSFMAVLEDKLCTRIKLTSHQTRLGHRRRAMRTSIGRCCIRNTKSKAVVLPEDPLTDVFS